MRLFVALPAYDSFLDEIRPFLRSARRLWPAVRWIPEKQIHLTVKFLGETERLSCVTEALGTVRAAPFTAGLGRELLVLGKENEARIIALKLEDSAFARLFRQVDEGLSRCAVPADRRPFLPHITVGRIKEKVSRRAALEILAGTGPLPRAEYPCNGLRLYESILRKEGPEYIIRGEYPFSESGPV